MSRRLSGLSSVELVTAARQAVGRVMPWVEDPLSQPQPGRSDVAAAVRLSAELLAQVAPGGSVELRVPPFVAVQCVEGVDHRRGTPPNVVQCSPITWLRVVVGLEELSLSDADVSGSRAREVERFLPLLRRVGEKGQ